MRDIAESETESTRGEEKSHGSPSMAQPVL